MTINRNKLLFTLKYISSPLFFIQRKTSTIFNKKRVDSWVLLIWKYLLDELEYSKDIKIIYRKDFDKFVLYYLNNDETNNLFNYICNGFEYFTYDSFLEFILRIHHNDFNRLINSFEKN